MDRDIKNTISDIVAQPKLTHLQGGLWIDDRLDATACCLIREQIDRFTLFGSDLDFFWLVYETLANKNIKKDFGEFYTPRHIIRFIVRTLLRDETLPRPLSCDPACGTGGFLVEAYLYLQNQYKDASAFSDDVLNSLRTSTFSGFDNNDTYSIPYARTNMLMAGGWRCAHSVDGRLTNGSPERYLRLYSSKYPLRCICRRRGPDAI